MFKTILVPVDGSEHANRAIAIAADMAVKYDAELILLHVMTNLGSARALLMGSVSLKVAQLAGCPCMTVD